ncbi:MAG: hypothetical protein AAF572_21865 [Cyanobacteria bacterium P01_B01_bin.77]
MYNFKLRQVSSVLGVSTIALFVGSTDVAFATHRGITINSSFLDGQNPRDILLKSPSLSMHYFKGVRMNGTSLDGQPDEGLICNDSLVDDNKIKKSSVNSSFLNNKRGMSGNGRSLNDQVFEEIIF